MVKKGVRTAKYAYIALIFIFLYAPIITLVVLSFNASKSRAVWGGFPSNGTRRFFTTAKSSAR